MEDVGNELLANAEVQAEIARRGPGGKAVFVMFDEETEALAAQAGLEIALPAAELRHRLDSKIVTTQLANDAGVPSAPNTLGRARSYEELLALADEAGLGGDLVVQTPYGDSGKTTFFIRTRADWDKNADALVAEELKVMKRINCAASAVEAVLTRHGTVVGPVMRDLTGHPELTPHKGGGRASSPSGSATAWPRRATAGSSRSTTSPTSTPASCTSASSTRASAA
jgi:biotin carboxylase